MCTYKRGGDDKEKRKRWIDGWLSGQKGDRSRVRREGDG